ncbi:MAG: PAS domain-containing sensor histidine kinase [Terriglobales bacterium]
MTQHQHISLVSQKVSQGDGAKKEDGAKTDPANRTQQGHEIFRLLVESVKDYAIFLLDPSGKVSTWNQGAERIKGYKAQEIIGQHFSRFYPREAIESKWPDRELEIASKEGRYTDEGLRVRKDGTTFWAHVVITALRDDTGVLRGFSKVTRDLTERKDLEERTRQLNKELRTRITQLLESQRLVELRTMELQKLSGELMRVQDEEHRRISRTLHDDLGQELVALKMELDVQNSGPGQKLSPAIELADRALSKVRNLSYLLHPPLLDESGLLPALHWYLGGLEKRSELRITFDYKPAVFPRLSRDLETAIFRVIQEALTNAYRHSGSQDARIEINQETDRVTVRIRDFGKGIGPAAASAGVGISGMKERIKQLNGELKVSRAEPGTLVEATMPLFDTSIV